MRTYWLSFCDGDLPKGSQFLGALVVDITDEERDEAELDVLLRFPNADMDAGPWLAACSKKAHRAKVNPGGEMMSVRMDELPNFTAISARFPRLTLLSKAEIEAIDDQIDAEHQKEIQ